MFALVAYAILLPAAGLQTHPDVHGKTSAGEFAPLSEEGYLQVAHLKDDGEMNVFVHRLLEARNMRATDKGELNGFVPWFSGTRATQNFDTLVSEILQKPWVAAKESVLPVPEVTEVTWNSEAESQETPVSSSKVVSSVDTSPTTKSEPLGKVNEADKADEPEQKADGKTQEPLGVYKIIYLDGVPVTATQDRSSEQVAMLNEGDIVNVVEVGNVVEGRVRAKISKPAGWISLKQVFVNAVFAKRIKTLPEQCMAYCSRHKMQWAAKCAWASNECSTCSPCEQALLANRSSEEAVAELNTIIAVENTLENSSAANASTNVSSESRLSTSSAAELIETFSVEEKPEAFVSQKNATQQNPASERKSLKWIASQARASAAASTLKFARKVDRIVLVLKDLLQLQEAHQTQLFDTLSGSLGNDSLVVLESSDGEVREVPIAQVAELVTVMKASRPGSKQDLRKTLDPQGEECTNCTKQEMLSKVVETMGRAAKDTANQSEDLANPSQALALNKTSEESNDTTVLARDVVRHGTPEETSDDVGHQKRHRKTGSAAMNETATASKTLPASSQEAEEKVHNKTDMEDATEKKESMAETTREVNMTASATMREEDSHAQPDSDATDTTVVSRTVEAAAATVGKVESAVHGWFSKVAGLFHGSQQEEKSAEVLAENETEEREDAVANDTQPAVSGSHKTLSMLRMASKVSGKAVPEASSKAKRAILNKASRKAHTASPVHKPSHAKRSESNRTRSATVTSHKRGLAAKSQAVKPEPGAAKLHKKAPAKEMDWKFFFEKLQDAEKTLPANMDSNKSLPAAGKAEHAERQASTPLRKKSAMAKSKKRHLASRDFAEKPAQAPANQSAPKLVEQAEQAANVAINNTHNLRSNKMVDPFVGTKKSAKNVTKRTERTRAAKSLNRHSVHANAGKARGKKAAHAEAANTSRDSGMLVDVAKPVAKHNRQAATKAQRSVAKTEVTKSAIETKPVEGKFVEMLEADRTKSVALFVNHEVEHDDDAESDTNRLQGVSALVSKQTEVMETLNQQIARMRAEIADAEADGHRIVSDKRAEYELNLTQQHQGNVNLMSANQKLASDLTALMRENSQLRRRAAELQAYGKTLRDELRDLSANISTADEYASSALNTSKQGLENVQILRELEAKEDAARAEEAHNQLLARVADQEELGDEFALMQLGVNLTQTGRHAAVENTHELLADGVTSLQEHWSDLDTHVEEALKELEADFVTNYEQNAQRTKELEQEGADLRDRKEAQMKLNERLSAAVNFLKQSTDKLAERVGALRSFFYRLAGGAKEQDHGQVVASYLAETHTTAKKAAHRHAKALPTKGSAVHKKHA